MNKQQKIAFVISKGLRDGKTKAEIMVILKEHNLEITEHQYSRHLDIAVDQMINKK